MACTMKGPSSVTDWLKSTRPAALGKEGGSVLIPARLGAPTPIIDVPTGDACLATHVLPEPWSPDELLIRCKGLTLIPDPKIIIWDRECTQHRAIGFYSDAVREYRYSGASIPAQNPPHWMTNLMHVVNTEYGTKFNAILVNLYRDGFDYIGAHSDDEAGLSSSGTVISLSLGHSRIFRIRNRKDKKIVRDLHLAHGMVAIMSGADFQRTFTHEILKEPSIRRARYSLTFREHKT
jgi:alkylated DNA repair dioxygenase AlkB